MHLHKLNKFTCTAQTDVQIREVCTIYENVVYRVSYIVYNDTFTMINEKYTIHTPYTRTIHIR